MFLIVSCIYCTRPQSSKPMASTINYVCNASSMSSKSFVTKLAAWNDYLLFYGPHSLNFLTSRELAAPA